MDLSTLINTLLASLPLDSRIKEWYPRMVEHVLPLRAPKKGGKSEARASGARGRGGTAGTRAVALPTSAPSAEISGDPDA